MIPAVAAPILALAVPALLGAQTVVEDGDRCTACYELMLEATLGTDEGPGALSGQPRSVVRDSRGRYFVAEHIESVSTRVFAPDGSHLRDLGGEGEGPGEYLAISSIWMSPRDSLFVFDSGRGLVSVYGPELAFARSFRFRGRVTEAGMVSADTLLVGADVLTPAHIGLPLHLIDRGGEILASFGSDGTFRPDVPGGGLQRNLAVDGDGTVWVAHRHQYVLDQWDGSSRAGRVVREAPWFRPYQRRTVGRDHVDPLVMAVQTLSNGHLRTVVSIAGPDWQENLPEPIVRNGKEIFPIPSGSGMYARLVEDIDPDVGRVVRSQVVGQEILGFVSEDLVYAYRLTPAGFPRIDVWRLTGG